MKITQFLNIYEGPPDQGLSRVINSARTKHEKNHQVLQATAGQYRFVGKQGIEAAAGVPRGGGGIYRNGGMGASAPIKYLRARFSWKIWFQL